MNAIGLIAGNGRFPELFARAAVARGLTVHAVAHLGESDPALGRYVASIAWVRAGQVARIVRALRARGVGVAVMAGGIGRTRGLGAFRPDAGALRVLARLRSLRDDEALRALAAYFEEEGVEIGAPTDFVPSVVVEEGLLAGPKPSEAQWRDVRLGAGVAEVLGRADVGQTVVVKDGVVLAVEAVEGTDAAIRRGARLAAPGVVIVKRAKPGQDRRFDLPAAGPVTLETMREVGARVLALEAGASVLLDRDLALRWAERYAVSVLGVNLRGA